MKLITVKKNLIKQTAVVVVILALLSAPAAYVDYLSDSYTTQSKDIESQGNLIAVQVSTLLAQYDSANNWLAFYDEIEKKRENKTFALSKTALRDTIAELRKKYTFTDFEVNMGDIKPKIDSKYKLETVFAEDSNVSIKFSAMSDTDVFYLMQSLQNSFSAVKFTSLKMNLDKELNNQTLLEIRSACFSPLVKGELTFSWSDLKNIKTEETEPLTAKDKPLGQK